METIKSICSGVLIIADANLRLAPGQTANVETISPDMEKAITRSLLARAGKEPIRETSPSIDDLSRLNVSEAIARINAESDPARIKSLMETEKRRSVIDAMKSRLAEVQNADK